MYVDLANSKNIATKGFEDHPDYEGGEGVVFQIPRILN